MVCSRSAVRVSAGTCGAWLHAALAVALLGSGCAARPALLVQLTSNMSVEREIDVAHVEVGVEGGAVLHAIDAPLTRRVSRPTRIAAFDDLPEGDYVITVELRFRGRGVQTRHVRRRVSGTTIVTLLMTRDCNGVMCPADDPAAVECLGGRCVPPSCDEEHPELCPAPECVRDGDCAAGPVSCALGTCSASGACYAVPDDTACGSDQTCDLDLGCVASGVDAGGTDAAMPADAGSVDAGVDAAAPLDAAAAEDAAVSSDSGTATDGGPIGPSACPDPGCPIDVAAGERHTCALLRDGRVRCWGTGRNGELGVTVPGDVALSPVDAAIDSVSAIELGAYHSCAVRLGAVWCWGANLQFQSGSPMSAPVLPPRMIPGLTQVVDLGLGAATSCALDALGIVSCWGSDLQGELGDGTPLVSRSTPGTVTLGARARVLAAGAHHVCAGDGTTVGCWGANGSGQIGDGATMEVASPVTSLALTGAVALALGGPPDPTQEGHGCAVTPEGTVSCWGANESYQLGINFDLLPGNSVDIGLAPARDVGAGGRFSCALRWDGSVWCWGANDQGQLGDGTTTSRAPPRPVTGISDAVAIGLGDRHACAVLASGVVTCWGAGTEGQLGNGGSVSSAVPVTIPMPL